MKTSKTHVTKLVFLAMMVALGVVISPILRVEGMCPMAHFINVTCAVMLGPWYAFVCALAIGIIRMVCMGIPPLALTGAVYGALAAMLDLGQGSGPMDHGFDFHGQGFAKEQA